MTLKKRVAMNKLRHTKHRLVKSTVYTGGFFSRKNKIVPVPTDHYEGDGYVYDGEIEDGKFNGKGKVTYTNGNVYEGDFKDGNFEGIGIFKFNNIDGKWNVYEGEFKNNEFDGTGELKYANGYVYKGDFKNGNFDGPGKMKYEDGSLYEGEIIHGLRNGPGKMKYKSGDIYEGNFKDDQLNGKGKITENNGDIYKGEIENGLRNGKGEITYKNGNVKEGEFKDDIITGRYVIFYNLNNEDVRKNLLIIHKEINENDPKVEKQFNELVNDKDTNNAIFIGKDLGIGMVKGEGKGKEEYGHITLKQKNNENFFVFSVTFGNNEKIVKIKPSTINNLLDQDDPDIDYDNVSNNTVFKFSRKNTPQNKKDKYSNYKYFLGLFFK